MKSLILIAALLGTANAHAQHGGHSMPHEMQHGFILAVSDTFASHLVANGHHSRQTEITGQLTIANAEEKEAYEKRKAINTEGTVYFLFQAQSLDLPSLKAGQTLIGHIVESKVGDYEPKNIIVKNATFKVEQVLLNLKNPFFADE